MISIEEAYRATIRAAVREAAADTAFGVGKTDDGAAIYRAEARIADRIIDRLAMHYAHTRKAKTQRKVQS